MTELFFPELRCGKTVISKLKWEDLRCNDCGGKLELEKDNEFESVKRCQDCGKSAILIKKIRDDVE